MLFPRTRCGRLVEVLTRVTDLHSRINVVAEEDDEDEEALKRLKRKTSDLVAEDEFLEADLTRQPRPCSYEEDRYLDSDIG